MYIEMVAMGPQMVAIRQKPFYSNIYDKNPTYLYKILQ